MHRLLLLLVCAVLGFSSTLLTNGDFEQDLSVGWTAQFLGQLTTDTIDRATTFDPDPDYELRVKKYDASYAKLCQEIDVPSTNLDFSVSTRLLAREYSASSPYWAAASIVLSYLNEAGTVLGETRIVHKSAHCPWTSTTTRHLIIAADSINWYTYSFNINDELANLPGVNPVDIARVRVTVFDTTNGC